MKKNDIDKKQSEINKKVADAKQTVQKRVTQLNRAPLKTVPEKPKEDKKPKADKSTEEQSWLSKYISDPEASGAKKVTALFARAEGLRSYHLDARKARDRAHSFSKYYDAMKISMLVETPDILKSQLNPVLAGLLQVSDQYNEACEQEQKSHDKQLEKVKKQEAKVIEHRRAVWQKACNMYKRKEIPDPLWKQFGNRANPTVIFNYLMGEEGVSP